MLITNKLKVGDKGREMAPQPTNNSPIITLASFTNPEMRRSIRHMIYRIGLWRRYWTWTLKPTQCPELPKESQVSSIN